MKNKSAFTLVELIVVVTILAILSTVGFVAFSGYLEGVRDTNRISQLKNISDGLSLYQAASKLPLPDNFIEIRQGSNVIGYQGTAGKNILEKIEFSAEGLDPKDGSRFTYGINTQRRSFSLMTYLEEENGLEGLALNSNTYANNSNRFPHIEGRGVGIILDNENTPAHDILDIIEQGSVDVSDVGAEPMKLYITNEDILIGTGSSLSVMNPRHDCKRLKDLKGSHPTGVYEIDPDGDGTTQKVYCDMETDGGGWTYTTMVADDSVQNMFSETGPNNNVFITDIYSNISTKGKLSNIWKDNFDRDIMLQCFSTEEGHSKYEFPFIMYDFPGDQKSNLTNDTKAGLELSDVFLDAKWKNINYQLNTAFSASSGNNDMIIEDFQSNDIFILRESGSGYELVSTTNSTSNENSPSYNTSATADLGGRVYCLSAIR